jgi:2-polyprenyl-6-methoxyphenol hydroxylase-like FAD-dependent oxidoreductase
MTRAPVVVVGGGVVGLTAAIVLQEAGFAVKVVAAATPLAAVADAGPYASPRAGAHWCR